MTSPSPLALTDDLFFARTDLDRNRVERLLKDKLAGCDDGELFLEYRQSEALLLDDGRIKSASFDTTQGFGLRAVAGEAQGYAHMGEISEAAILRAVAATSAVRAGYAGSFAPAPIGTNRSLYRDTNPLGEEPFETKVKLLGEIDAYVRRKDPRVKQVSVSLAGEWQAIQILRPDGYRVGVVNGLSVFHTGDVEFGQPLRITAVVALGREGIIDVEREAQLGGAIHTKGVAILRGYLSRMFGQERPLSLRAQLVFEQSYGEIEGDSASSSELFAVLSALSDVGIDQGIAVTGSVNQLGEIQAIGGLCAKIEGFYDLCAARGLTGTQGVLIPRSNLAQLVLRADVVRAVSEGRFHVYAIATVAQGIEVLMGLPAGDRDAAGRFPAASVFGRVERRIIEIAERLRQAEAHGFGDEGGIDEGGGGEMSENSDYRMLKPAPKSGGPRPRSLG